MGVFLDGEKVIKSSTISLPTNCVVGRKFCIAQTCTVSISFVFADLLCALLRCFDVLCLSSKIRVVIHPLFLLSSVGDVMWAIGNASLFAQRKNNRKGCYINTILCKTSIRVKIFQIVFCHHHSLHFLHNKIEKWPFLLVIV